MGDAYLAGYCERIGFRGELAPTLAVLKELHERHPTAIGFENLTPFAGDVVPLDIPSIYNKLVVRRRGGYCFEHNLLLSHMLKEIGFQVTQLAARSVWQAAAGVTGPRTHMILKVEVEGKAYIADGGFGGQTLVAPMEMIADKPQQTACGVNRIHAAENGLFFMQVRVGDAWRDMYAFDFQEQHFIDYEVSNWYLCTHPASKFKRELIVSTVENGQRYALFNNRFTVYAADGTVLEKTWLHTVEEIESVLRDRMHLTVPEDDRLRTLFAQKAALPAEI